MTGQNLERMALIDEQLETEKYAAHYLQVSVQTLRNRRVRRRLSAYVKLDSRIIRYHKSDLDACTIDYRLILPGEVNG